MKFLQSVLAALVGVQSQKKQEEDFQGDRLERMVLISLAAAGLLILVVLLMVNIALPA